MRLPRQSMTGCGQLGELIGRLCGARWSVTKCLGRKARTPKLRHPKTDMSEPQTQGQPPSDAGLPPAPCSASPLDDPDYQAFVEEMAKLCRCTPLSDRPCDGLLAGGPCDDLHLDENHGCCDGARSDYFCGE